MLCTKVDFWRELNTIFNRTSRSQVSLLPNLRLMINLNSEEILSITTRTNKFPEDSDSMPIAFKLRMFIVITDMTKKNGFVYCTLYVRPKLVLQVLSWGLTFILWSTSLQITVTVGWTVSLYVVRGHEASSFIGITLVYPILKDTPRFFEKQGCALRKIERSPVLRTREILGAQHMISMKNFLVAPEQ